MPYISREDRDRVMRTAPQNAGELNYALTVMILGYIRRKGLRYSVLNEVLGVLAAMSHEIYRRMAAPYEDRKMGENGDVFP